MLEVAIPLMTYLINFVFQIKQKDLNLSVFNMLTGINESKNINKAYYHANANENLMEENVIQINERITITV